MSHVILKNVSKTYGNVGVIHKINLKIKKGEFDKAIECYEQSIEIANLIGDKRGQGLQLNNLAMIYHKLSKYNP